MPALTQDILLTDTAKRVVKIAQAIAKENMHPAFGPPHVLKALLHKDAALQPLLKTLDKDIYYIEEWAEVRMEACKKSTSPADPIAGDNMVEEIMNEADNIRRNFLKDSIEPLHVLAAVCTPGVGFSFEQLKTLPILCTKKSTSMFSLPPNAL